MHNVDEELLEPRTDIRTVENSQECHHIYKLKIANPPNKSTSLNRTYSQIYEKYGYPTFKLSKTQVPSKVQLSKLSDSNCSLKLNNVRTQEITPSVHNLLTTDEKSYQSEDSGSLLSDCVLPPNRKSTLDSNLDQNDSSKTLLRKKRRRRRITICISNCRYASVRRVASSYGMREVSEDEAWNFYWTDMSISVERAKEMKRFQRINHFPGMLEICRKDLLARNLNRMQKCFPKDYNFFPKTWCLPTELNDALNYNKLHKNKTFIIKPECGSQGRGIFLTKNLKDLKISERLICQQYISKPYLIDGYKFDIRVYTLITSCDPLRLFVYNEGLVRFATSQYADPNSHNTTNVFMHLTNYAVNRHSRTFVTDNESGSKRKISTLNLLLKSQGVDIEKMWYAIDQAIVKTVISAWPILRHSYRACFPSHDAMHACFEILGFDILLDQNLQPYILEVNHSPSFHTETNLDREVKDGLLTDTFQLLNIWQCDRRKVLEEDRRRIKERLLQKSQKGMIERLKNVESELLKENDKSPWLAQVQWEEDHLGNFRRVYPAGDDYADFFHQPSSSLYTSTTSSRLRGDCARQQREDIEQARIKAEALKKLPLRNFKEQDETESQVAAPAKGNDSIQVVEKKEKLKPIKKLHVKRFSRNSFEPLPIVESEERERITQLARRDFLIRSYGLLEQIYQTMKQVGTLRLQDRLKYGLYDRSSENAMLNGNNILMLEGPQDAELINASNVLNHSSNIFSNNNNHNMVPQTFSLRNFDIKKSFNRDLQCSELPLHAKNSNMSCNFYEVKEKEVKKHKDKRVKSDKNNNFVVEPQGQLYGGGKLNPTQVSHIHIKEIQLHISPIPTISFIFRRPFQTAMRKCRLDQNF